MDVHDPQPSEYSRRRNARLSGAPQSGAGPVQNASSHDGGFAARWRWRGVAAVLVAGVVVLGVLLWKRGTPYQLPFRSPNGDYYVQKYSNSTLARLRPSMPGQGSDGVDGYIRLYDRNGKLLRERFEFFIRDVKPLWSEDKVYLRGVARMDAEPWVLPHSSE